VTHTVRIWRPRVLRVLALAVAIAAAPLPALAEDAAPPVQSRPGIAASVQKIAATETLATGAKPQVAASQQGGTTSADLGSKSFFKTPAGIITLAVVGAGLGYALYSTSHDRVESPHVAYQGGVR
jgi:hypothetical protein